MRLLLLAALLATARAAPADQVTPQQAAGLYAWFDQLPLPSVKDLKAVRIWNGGPWQAMNPQLEPLICLGFLVEDGEKEFRAVSPDGALETFLKKSGEPGQKGFAGYRETPFADQVREFLAKDPSPDQFKTYRDLYGITADALGWSSRLFMLARWSEQRGDHDLAAAIWVELQSWRRAQETKGSIEPLDVQLQAEFGATLCRRTTCLLAEKGVLRPAVLANLRQIAALCPKADLKEAKTTIALLEKMIAEDAAHPALTDDQLTALPPAQRAEELAFRLRDERTDFAVPGVTPNRRARPTDPWPGNGAAKALDALGLAAVPALAKALDDQSLTREMMQPGEGDGVRPVQNLVLDLLRKISGCTFRQENPMGLAPKTLRKMRKTPGFVVLIGNNQQQALLTARDWAKGVSERGEKAFLIKSLETGDPCPEYARRLLERYPDDAIPVIIDAARTRPDVADRTAFAQFLWKQKDPRCREFFEDELFHGAELADRLAAAQAFQELHDPRGLAAMCAEWRKIEASHPKLHSPEDEDGSSNDPWEIIRFLADSAAPEAILALDDSSASLSVEWRTTIIETLLSARERQGGIDGHRRRAHRLSRRHGQRRPNLLSRLLLERLAAPCGARLRRSRGHSPYSLAK
jgi:hypothetical protein